MRNVLLLGLLLTGCATSKQSWVGRTEQDLVEAKGLPDQQLTNNQGKIYQYQKCSGYAIEDTIVNRCRKVLFFIEGGKIARVEVKRS